MRKINKEDMKIGDFVYIKYKEKPESRRYIVKINELDTKNNLYYIGWWKLKDKSKEKLTHLFEPLFNKQKDSKIDGNCNLYVSDWDYYDLFRLNKKEILEFKRYLILKNLK